MPPRRRRRRETLVATRLPLFLEGTRTDLVCYIPPGRHHADEGRIVGPYDEWQNEWIDDRDRELCNRIYKETGFSVYCERYNIRAKRLKNGTYQPNNWIDRNVYAVARGNHRRFKNKYQRLHLVGYSAGGSVASSQLLAYPNPIVKSMVIINGKVAVENRKGFRLPHVNAAFDADKIIAKTRPIYGDSDDFRKHADVWREKNPRVDFKEYKGGHDFFKEGKFGEVLAYVLEWLKSSVRG